MAQKSDQGPFSPSTEKTSPAGIVSDNGAGPALSAPVSRSRLILGFVITWLYFMAGITLWVVAINNFPPMRLYEVASMVLLIAAPVAIGITQFLSRAFPVVQLVMRRRGPGDATKAGVWSARMFLFLPTLALLFGSVIMVNGMSDHSPLTPYTLTVTDKSYTTSKNGNRHYYAVVESPAKPILPFAFDHSEHLKVDSTLYKQIENGVTQVSIDTHDGFFGLPWIAAQRFLGPYAGDQTQPNVAAPLNQNPVASATPDPDWAALTEFDRSIEPITPQELNREYWPNGYPKQEEPLVGGQIHGIAHYWFDNGKPYGDIPWNHGKKHGKFKLYRPDGTLEQVLSYKNGQPHGILQWYNRDGSLQQSWVYVDGVARKRLK